MKLFIDQLSQNLTYFHFWARSRLGFFCGQTADRKDLNFQGRIQIFLGIAPMSTKKSYLKNLIFERSANFFPKRYGVATGIPDKPFVETTRIFFHRGGFFVPFAMVYGFARISRFLELLGPRPSTTGLVTLRGACAKTIGWILTTRKHKLVTPRALLAI